MSNEDLEYLQNCDLDIVKKGLNLDKDVARVYIGKELTGKNKQ